MKCPVTPGPARCLAPCWSSPGVHPLDVAALFGGSLSTYPVPAVELSMESVISNLREALSVKLNAPLISLAVL